MSLLADIKFKRKEGTWRTWSKLMSLLKEIVPVESIGTDDPVGKLTEGIGEGLL